MPEDRGSGLAGKRKRKRKRLGMRDKIPKEIDVSLLGEYGVWTR